MSNQTKYESCKLKNISKTMKEFEVGQLKTKSNRKIKSRKQAIAIGLTIANSNCEKYFSNEDYMRIENRFMKNMYNSNGKLKDDKITYTSVKSGIKLYDYYKNKKNMKMANKIKNDMVLRIFKNIEIGYINQLLVKDMVHFLEK